MLSGHITRCLTPSSDTLVALPFPYTHLLNKNAYLSNLFFDLSALNSSMKCLRLILLIDGEIQCTLERIVLMGKSCQAVE